MAKPKPKNSSEALSIQNEMRQFDLKNRGFYDSLTQEDQKKFSPYLMIRWGSAVEGSPELQEYYLLSTNERLNRNFFDVNTAQHKKLQWLMATTVSPDLGPVRHTWIAPRKKTSDKIRQQLEELFPTMADPELDTLAKITTQQEIDEYLEQLGQR
jgi:hypothetical protein